MKRNSCSYLILVLLCALFPLVHTVAQKIYLPHYTTKDGLPSNNCYYTLQDRKGYIWIATDAGVSRFDGAVFENFSVDDGLPDNQILQLREDSKGRIWFLALNGQLSYFYNGKIFNQYTDKQLESLNFNSVIVSFFEDSKSRFWFGTNNNIIGLWDGKKTTKLYPPNKNDKYQNIFIYEDAKHDIWAINNNSNYIYKQNGFVRTQNPSYPISHKTLQYRRDKSIYLIDKKGLHITNNNVNTLIIALDSNLLNTGLGYIHADGKELWLSTNNGAYGIKYNGETRQFLQGIIVNQVEKDKEGNIWFTTKNGIYKLPKLKDQLYILNHENGLSNNTIKSIVKDNKNRLWLGSVNGGIDILDLKSRKVSALQLPNASKFSTIKQLVPDQKNNKMFFASDYGLGYINIDYPKTKKLHFLRETNNLVYVVKNFAIDTTTKLALSLSSAVVILNDREKLEFSSLKYKEQQDFFKDRSYRVFYDSQQSLWFSNISGLSEFSHNKLNKHYEKYPLLTKRINDMQELQSGTMVMATDGYGLIIFENGKITQNITHKNGLNNNIVNKVFTKEDYLWTIGNTGINRISIDKNRTKISSYDDVNGMLSDDLNDLYIDKDTAYFATNNGLIYFAYNHTLQETQAPKVYITSIINNRQKLDLGHGSFTLKPNEQSIILNYSAIDFKNRNISYRYRLKGNGNWVETKSRRLELSSLEPGEYTFEVSAKSQDSGWSEPAKVKFVLQKHFYQTWWFLAMLIGIGAYFIYVVTVKMTRQQKNKEQEQLLLKNKILMLEQKALQAMMNPHFVFNVMNSIQHYINTKNTSSANKVLTGFAKLIRKNLEVCTKSYITLDEEIEYLNLYLNLEKYRFGDQFQYHIHLAEDIDKEDTFIPSMLLQPYIENAIWHGIMPKQEGGEVTIDISNQNDEYLLIKIIDDGVGIDNSLKNKKESHESKGMTLTNERINLLNKIEAKPIHLSVQQNGKVGTIVTISIPFLP
ncbi:sensor histidine kinase [Pedobacter sp. ASV28]|uniref:sensor histidine kinase n=1 Tax=Pedobacter sp. ASV28 TaxID=2795123 RepID=UPI0018EB53BD|nr:sensor histidine kinase [Pedobacter sp. ASV28]